MALDSKAQKGSAGIWTFILLFLLAVLFFGGAFALYYFKEGKKITARDLKAYEKMIGLEFTNKERKMILKRGFSGYQREKLRSILTRIDRQALHAYKLDFLHPVEQRPMSFESDLPDDIGNLLMYLREKAGEASVKG